jgi:hypothetical protein
MSLTCVSGIALFFLGRRVAEAAKQTRDSSARLVIKGLFP